VNGDLILVLVIGAALIFDFTNGFHDTANVVATSSDVDLHARDEAPSDAGNRRPP
jgi:hypothetical protein